MPLHEWMSPIIWICPFTNDISHLRTVMSDCIERICTITRNGIQPNAGALTNFEVLNFLRSRGAGKDPTRLIASIATSEYKVYDYLEQTAACNQTRELVTECKEKCKTYDLAKSEILNIVNIRPSIPAEMDPIIEQWEARIGLEKMEELVECVAQLLPPAAPKPEENESGEEATDKGNDENLAGNESVGTSHLLFSN